MGLEDAQAQLHGDITTYGWHVVKVGADDAGPSFAFTIGLYKSYGKPELIVFGLPPDDMHQLLNAMGEAIRDGKSFLVGPEYENVLPGYSCTFRRVPARGYHEYLRYACWYYNGDAFPALQLIWPDREHRFPWTAPADAWVRRVQPVLADQ